MTREELTNEFLSSTSRNYILQLPTGYGKTKLALQKVNTWTGNTNNFKILIVIPRLILIKGWKEEILKWKYDYLLPNIVFTTYVSLHKHCSTKWDVVIFDEGHHTSERCRDILRGFSINHLIVLSATLKKEHIYYFNSTFKTKMFQVKVKDAIESDVLPDPKLILIPLTLDNRVQNHFIIKNAKKNNGNSLTTINFIEKWKYRSYKGPLKIRCTQQQYYNDLSSLIDWYKQKRKSSAVMKNMWLHKAGERLKWLAKQKENVIKNILKEFHNYRTLVFCPSIEDSLKLGSPCINSKVGTNNLALFNNKKIKHIAAVGMLDEGFNPVDCRIGIFYMINSSDRITLQRIGRILRHKSPVLIFPYFVNTREQEIIEEITKDYNPNLIIRLSSSFISNIKNYL